MSKKEEPEKTNTKNNHVIKDAAVIRNLLAIAGIQKYDPIVVNYLLEFVHSHVMKLLEEAKKRAAGENRKMVLKRDVDLPLAFFAESLPGIPMEVLISEAAKKNVIPLQKILPRDGLCLPPEKYLLCMPNYRMKSLRKESEFKRRIVSFPLRDRTIAPQVSKELLNPQNIIRVPKINIKPNK